MRLRRTNSAYSASSRRKARITRAPVRFSRVASSTFSSCRCTLRIMGMFSAMMA